MADVLQKIINANPVRNGSIVTGVMKIGNYDTVDPPINKYQFFAQTGILDERFDDITYYTT